jgi:hypothetical protein
VCVEPAQLVRCTSTKRVTQDCFIWVEDCELFQEFFRFSQSVSLFEDDVATNGTCYGGNKLNDRLMRQAHRVFDDAAPENLGCNPLLAGKAAVKPVDQNVRIDESGHARTGPL